MTTPGREKPRRHGEDHRAGGADPAAGPWISVGTPGTDDGDGIVDFSLNPSPYGADEMPGPPPFTTGTNGFALDADGNPGGGLRYRWEIGGVRVDCGGGITGLSPGDVITTLIGVPLPDYAQRILDADDSTDTPGSFVAQLLPSGDLVYIGPAGSSAIDGGSP